ncbi:MAG: 30S ribosomal protein S4 [archaeon]|nr:30S ribosomal protein S4 [archaeon]
MGDPIRFKNQFRAPKKRWNKARIETERGIKETYGLKNKKELWRMEAILKNKRENARKLLALPLDQRIKREKELLDGLKKYGLVKDNSILDDVLSLRLEEILERRLQTIVMRKNLANTPKQARQFIVHGHIAINKRKMTTPSYLVPLKEETQIEYYGKEMFLMAKIDKTKKLLKKEEVNELQKEFEDTVPEELKQEMATTETELPEITETIEAEAKEEGEQ